MVRSNKKSNKAAPSRKKMTSSKHKSTGEKTPILLVLAQMKSTGRETPLRKQVSQLTGYPMNSLSTLLGNLKKKHYVEYDARNVWLTEDGWVAAQNQFGEDAIGQVLDNAATLEKLAKMYKLAGAKLKIFELLKDGSAKSYDEIMKHIGCTNKGSFGTYTSALNSAELTEAVSEDGVKMLQLVESTCFPFGRP